MKKKFAIISACDSKYGAFLINHWLKSLIDNVKLDMIDIVILDYGLTKSQNNILISKKVKVIKCVKNGNASIIRYGDMLKFLNKNSYKQVLSCDGGDIIFQKDISHLFSENKKSFRGVCEDISNIEMFSIFMDNFNPNLRREILKKLKGKSIINAGFIIAPTNKLKGLCKKVNKLIINKNKFGADQILVNYELYREGFVSLDKGFNFIPTTMYDKFKIKKGVFYRNSEVIPVVHNAGRTSFFRVITNFGYGAEYNRLNVWMYYLLRITYRFIIWLNLLLNRFSRIFHLQPLGKFFPIL